MTTAAGNPIRAGIVGGTGYTGVELLRLLARHPQVSLQTITSRKEAGQPVADLFYAFRPPKRRRWKAAMWCSLPRRTAWPCARPAHSWRGA